MSLQGDRKKKGICKDSIKLLTSDVNYSPSVETGMMVGLWVLRKSATSRSLGAGFTMPAKNAYYAQGRVCGCTCTINQLIVRTVSRCLQQNRASCFHIAPPISPSGPLRGRLIPSVCALEVAQ